MDIKPGDKIYRVDKYQTLYENVIEFTVSGINHSGCNGFMFILFSKGNNGIYFPIFKDELERSYIILRNEIVATSLKALKQAVFKDIAEYNKSNRTLTKKLNGYENIQRT